MTDTIKPPLVEWGEHLDDLGWHALNYRTAHTVHAEAMWQELEACVERKVNAAVAQERERCAQLCEQWDATHPQRLAAAIRAGEPS